MGTTGWKRALIGVAALAGVAALIALYGSLDPAGHHFPRCPFLTLTGWQCPGCGSQRAAHALLHGDIASAWHLNAMLVLCLPILSLLGIASLLRTTHPRLYARVNSRPVCLGLAAAFILWAILRNIF